jgi:hypothetical protein
VCGPVINTCDLRSAQKLMLGEPFFSSADASCCPEVEFHGRSCFINATPATNAWVSTERILRPTTLRGTANDQHGQKTFTITVVTLESAAVSVARLYQTRQTFSENPNLVRSIPRFPQSKVFRIWSIFAVLRDEMSTTDPKSVKGA